MMSCEEILMLHNLHQKFDTLETSVSKVKLGLLDFLPNINAFFERFLVKQTYYSCRLLDNKKGKIKID
jgi:hypothetical protein